jgi:hypothetical protein
MTTITLTGSTPDVPTNINTLERLLAHNVLAAGAIFGNATFNLDNGEGSATPYIQNDIGFVNPIKTYMMRTLLYLPINPDIYSNALNQRPWNYANEVTNNAYLAAYRAG